MKTRLLIIVGIILAVAFTAFSVSNLAGDFSSMSGQKYQYKFGETTIKNEKNQQFDRVFFSYSHDYGKTFSEPQDISMSENTWTGETKMILMDDYVILVWREEIIPAHTLAFATSDDHGKNLEKKYLWIGSRPDIVHYNDVLYLTWVDLETRQVLYTTSDNRGETFGEHHVIFAPTNKFSPYALKPEPKFVIEDDAVKITWKSAISEKGDTKNFEFTMGEDESKICAEDQIYNEVLFKCVMSCEDDLVYNGYTDSCTTEFDLKYHGYCDEGLTYSPSLHVCLGNDSDIQTTPLKDPPRTTPPEPEPEPIPDSESLQRQKQQQAKLDVQKWVLTDTRDRVNQINAIREYRDKFEPGYFLEQFIHPIKQNYEKDQLMNFIYGEWGFQPTENISPKVTVYFRSYENYDKIEKINEWQKPKNDASIAISHDSDGFLLMRLHGMSPATGTHETCVVPGEYGVSASNPYDESKVAWGYFTCQNNEIVGEPQPWMEIPE